MQLDAWLSQHEADEARSSAAAAAQAADDGWTVVRHRGVHPAFQSMLTMSSTLQPLHIWCQRVLYALHSSSSQLAASVQVQTRSPVTVHSQPGTQRGVPTTLEKTKDRSQYELSVRHAGPKKDHRCWWNSRRGAGCRSCCNQAQQCEGELADREQQTDSGQAISCVL